MLDDLDSEPWASLEHAYGAADDVPGLIRALVSGESGWETAARQLHAALYHQGRCFTATAVAVTYLVEALGSVQSPRAGILRLLAEFGGAHRHDAVVGYDPHVFRPGHDDVHGPEAAAAHAAVRGGHPTYLELLGAGDPQVRALAAHVVAGCPDEAVVTAADLVRRLHTEPDDAVRAAQVFALGRCGGPSVPQVLREHLESGTALLRSAAAIELVRTAPEQADDTALRLLTEAAGTDVTTERGVPVWGGHPMAGLAAAAAAELARTRPREAEGVVRTALNHRLGQGQRALTPYFWRDGPPAGADADQLIRHDTALRALVAVLTPLVFGDLVDREQPVTRHELTDDQVAVLRWTVDADLPVPVAAVPWPDAARMARFLDGPAEPLEAPLTVNGDGGPRTAPVWRWFWDHETARSVPLGTAVADALRAQRSPVQLLALARDTFTGAYRLDPWPRRPIALIRQAIESHPDGATGAEVTGYLGEWARQLDENSDADQAFLVLDLLAVALARRGETLPEHLDHALARAITAPGHAAGLLEPLPMDRRSRVIAQIRNPYWLRKTRELGDPAKIAELTIRAVAVDPAWPASSGARDLLVALGPSAVPPLTAALRPAAGHVLSSRHRLVFSEALDKLQTP